MMSGRFADAILGLFGALFGAGVLGWGAGWIREAHRAAVTEALHELERYTQARIGGNHPAETTGKFIAAKFEHDTARPVAGYAAPQLHTHAVIFNVTERVSVLRAITACRTAALGGHLDSCSRCDLKAISYNSCRNRHCPKCQAQARQRWLARREQDLLPVPYFHVVFTLPHALNPLCQRHPRLLYDLLFRATAETMLEVAADPRHLGARIGFLSILHT